MRTMVSPQVCHKLSNACLKKIKMVSHDTQGPKTQ